MLAFSAFAFGGYYNPKLVTDLFKSSKKEDANGQTVVSSREAPPDVDPVSLTDSHAIIVVKSDSFFTPDGAKALRHIVDELESRDYIRQILWMDRVPILNIFGLPEPLLPRSSASQTRFDAAREKALRHPLLAGQLLSLDGKHLIMLVNFELLFIENDEDCTTGLREAAEEAAADFPEVDFEFKVTGRLPMYVTAIESRDANNLKYQIIAYSMIGIMSIILFRGIVAVLIVSIAPVLGVVWSLGIIRYLDIQNNPFNQVVVPVLISLVALTDGVHLMVQIRKRRAEGLSPKEAARAGLREVGLACFLTSLTTAIGFGSLYFSHSELVQEFGISCVIGVSVTFFAVIFSIPIACRFFGKNVHVGHATGLVDRNLGHVGLLVEFVMKRIRLFSWLAIFGTVGLLAVSLSLRPDEKLSNSFPQNSEAVQGLYQMDQAFGGLEVVTVSISWNDDVNEQSDELLQVLRKVDALIRKEELAGPPISLCNLLDALPGDKQATDRMMMLELLPPPLKRAFYVPENHVATVNFRLQDLGIATYGPVFERIEAGLHEICQEQGYVELQSGGRQNRFTAHMSGGPVWRWNNLYRVVVDLAVSLGTATLIIFVVLAVVYRSLKIGLISLVPNLFPLALTGTYLVLSGQMLEIVSVCAFTVCLGIAVDDTIHFLTRYVEEKKKVGDNDQAIRNAFTSVGTSLIMTTIVLCAGFATVLWSDARDHQIFGTMGGLTIASALFADLVFLPALLSRFLKSDNRGESSGEKSGENHTHLNRTNDTEESHL